MLVTTNTVRGGLGNRLPSLVTGFLLALLTRRTLMLDFEGFDDFFAHPLDFGWQAHAGRLAARGQDLTYAVFEEQLPASNVYSATDFAGAHANTSVLHILQDRDWLGAVLAANPHASAFCQVGAGYGRVSHPNLNPPLEVGPAPAGEALLLASLLLYTALAVLSFFCSRAWISASRQPRCGCTRNSHSRLIHDARLHFTSLQAHFPTGSVFHPLARFLLRLAEPMRARVHEHMRRHFTAHTIGIQARGPLPHCCATSGRHKPPWPLSVRQTWRLRQPLFLPQSAPHTC